MKIDKLSIQDFRGIHELAMELNGRSTVLYGVNGVGKSTVLSAINLLYANILNRLARQKFKQSIKMEASDIKYKKAAAYIAADFCFGRGNDIFPYSRGIVRENARVTKSISDVKSMDGLTAYFERLYIGETKVDEENNFIYPNEAFNLPVFVSYGVNRLVLKTPLRIRKKPSYGQYDAYLKAIENQIAFGELFEWFLEQELYEVHMQKMDSQYEDKHLGAVKKAMVAMLDGFKDIHIVARPYSMKVYRGEEVLDILQLSDGEKCTLALFGDLARRLAVANPSMDNPLEGEGVVLIDEVELHMHTSWQRKVIRVLKETFPNVQFIITTHSPLVLGEVPSDFEVLSLYRTEDSVQADRMPSFYGVDSNTVLEDAMHTDSVNCRIKELVGDMYHNIEEKNYSKAEQIAEQIDEITEHRNVDTVRARIMIRKGRKLNASDTKKN